MKQCAACGSLAVGVRREAIQNGVVRKKQEAVYDGRMLRRELLAAHFDRGKPQWLCDVHLRQFDVECARKEAERRRAAMRALRVVRR